MKYDIRAQSADIQIAVREILDRCLNGMENVYYEVYANAWNKDKEYAIAYQRRGGSTTFGIDLKNRCLTD